MANAVSVYVGETRTLAARASIEQKGIDISYMGYTKRGDALLKQIFGAVDKLRGYEGIGIAMPGVLNANKGIVHKARNLGIKDLHIVNVLERRYKVPVYLTNTSVAMALGEKLFGAGKGVDNLAFLNMSTGIEVGVILNGRVLLGKQGNAHEIGHTIIDASSEVRCGCGRKGHWEAFCSGSGIPNFASYLLSTKYKNDRTPLHKVREISVDMLFRSARRDRAAAKIVSEIGRLNTIGVANIIELYDPELITLGGWLPVVHPQLINPIVRGVGGYVARLNRKPRIMITPLRSKAGLYGAVADFL